MPFRLGIKCLRSKNDNLVKKTSSGRDSNPRPSGPKPDALARLRYHSIFKIFHPISSPLSITHFYKLRPQK